jgi:hypothetical protein
MSIQIFTIGHSSHPLGTFLWLLHKHEIEALVDVRRYPVSRRNPHFSREALSACLAEESIQYHWLEPLGGNRKRAKDAPPSLNRGIARKCDSAPPEQKNDHTEDPASQQDFGNDFEPFGGLIGHGRGTNMGQPVKLSDELVDDARAIVPFSQRSIASQIEFWAGLGKSIEPLLRGDRAMSLKMSGAEESLSQVVSQADSARGRKRVLDHLKRRPYPHYKSVPGRPDLVCRIEADGAEVVGHFVGRDFERVETDR